ncbi:MAG: hypothetical protein LBD14_02615 [Puniceicoccales bacterium]|jgi:hypothetical protein|nr:hypothetical protein [Puniceicoccales bacterium]
MSATFSQEQKNALARWVSDGVSLSEIQKRINAEFGFSMTYMDVRFLIDDLDLRLKDKAPAAPEPAPDATAKDADAPADPDDDGGDATGAAGKVSVNIDPVQRPGIALGGSVTFSDGKTGQWQMDAYGQLGFIPPHEGYQPTQQDVQQFQVLLRREIAKGGY